MSIIDKYLAYRLKVKKLSALQKLHDFHKEKHDSFARTPVPHNLILAKAEIMEGHADAMKKIENLIKFF